MALLGRWGRPDCPGRRPGLVHRPALGDYHCLRLLGGLVLAGLTGHPSGWYYFSLPDHTRALGFGSLAEPGTILNLGIIWGAGLAALAASEFRLHLPRRWQVVPAALAGGIMMGYSARIAMGYNIGVFFNGIASLSLRVALWPGAGKGPTWGENCCSGNSRKRTPGERNKK
ncbi:putative inner membrane protein [Moorella thermoacetica]|uniref:Putative inner membrane protein n=1 Tax=Neomoorella thermoacetica TaxID=1525 RepID=A0A1J5NMA0_NEOTH|nr:putative inner membrane protein [Moorella thermoacetica]